MTHKSHKPVTALFPGTFNPFTLGHKSIADRALKLFDRLVIAVGVNAAKDKDPDMDTRVAAIRKLYANNPRIEVIAYSGLTVDLCRETGATVMVRGVRSVADFEYERDLADVNLHISGIETVMLPADPALAWLSSSVVRELRAHGRDTAPYLPHP